MSYPLYLEIDTKRSEALFRIRNGKKPELGYQLAAEARALFATLPADDPARGELSASMAELLLELGNLAEAEKLIKDSLVVGRASLDANTLGTHYMFLAKLLTNQARWDEAEECVLRAIDGPFGEIEFCHGMLRRIRAAQPR